MEQISLPFKKKIFEKGDRVTIVSKSVGDPLPFGYWDVGSVGYITSVEPWNNSSSYFLGIVIGDERAGRFLHVDLRRF